MSGGTNAAGEGISQSNTPEPQLTSDAATPPIEDHGGPTITKHLEQPTQARSPLEEVLVSLPEIAPLSHKASNGGKSSKPGSLRKRNSHRKSTASPTHGTGTVIVHTEVPSDETHTKVGQGRPEIGSSTLLRHPYADDEDYWSDPPSPPKFNIEQSTSFWEQYNKAADLEDREFVKAEGVNLDTLLIFAGLFSGVNTAFILESLKTIQPDPTEQANYLIRAVIHVLQNSTVPENILDDQPFLVPPRAVRATIVFFASLSCSLTAAFGAVLGKQWLNHYEREGVLKSPPVRARERQKKLEARDRWCLQGVIETLPTALQISLFLFFIALVDYLQPINEAVSWAVLGFSLVPALFYAMAITIATVYPNAPFQTRLSIVLHVLSLRLCHRALSLFNDFDSFLQPLSSLLRVDTWLSEVPPLRAGMRWLWKSSLLPRRWLSLQASRLYAISRQAWHSLSGNSSHQPIPPANEDIPDLLDMRCMIFTCKRVSTLQEISSVLPALDLLVESLPNNLDKNHPVVSLFARTVINSVIGPICYSTRQQEIFGSLWEEAGIDLRHLIRPVHCLFLRWGHTSEFNADFQDAIARGLWASFARDPLNIGLVKILVQLMQNPTLVCMQGGARSATYSTPDLGLLIRCIRFHSTWSTSEITPYLSMLPHLPLNRILCSQNRFTPLRHDWDSRYVKIVPDLSSTAWGHNGPDLDYRRGWMRVHILRSHAQDTLMEKRYSEYLLLWAKANVSQASIGNDLSVKWPYLQSLQMLLELDNTGKMWAERLEQEDHVSFLLQMIRGELPLADHDNHPCQSLTALFLFITIWHRTRPLPCRVAINDNPSIYLTPESLHAAVGSLANVLQHQWYRGGVFSNAPSNLELTVLYFEEASRLSLLTQNMETVVEGYKRNTDGIIKELDEDDQIKRCRDQRQSLFDRMDKLTFVKQLKHNP